MFNKSCNVFDESTAFNVDKILWYIILFTERTVFEVIAVKYNTNVQPSKRLYFGVLALLGESNGKLSLRTCPGCSVPEPYRSSGRALVHAQTSPRSEYY